MRFGHTTLSLSTGVGNRPIISGVPGVATRGTAYSFTPTVSNAPAPVKYALTGTLPTGLSFNTTTGAITGTPTVGGVTSGLVIRVTAANGSSTLTLGNIVVANYFLSATGSDALAGTTPATAWQTLTKLGATALVPGDVVAFKGGDTFVRDSFGGIYINVSGTSGSPIVFTSYGTGRATINAQGAGGLPDYGFVGDQVSWVTIDNLNFTATAGANTQNGIYFGNATGKAAGIVIRNVDVGNFGKNGIWLTGEAGTAGFASPLIEYVTVHDCCYQNTSSINAGIIMGGSAPSLGLRNAITSPVVRYCTSCNNLGNAADLTNPVGNGIVLAQCNSPLITNCIAYNNSINGARAVGIWFYDCESGIIRYCESYLNKSSSFDGSGFDLDVGCVNCTIEYCYSHDNDGSGFILYSAVSGAISAHSGNVIRYCISQNDARDGSTNQDAAGLQMTTVNNTTSSGNKVHNCTFYQSQTIGRIVAMNLTAGSTTDTVVANCIFIAANSAAFMNVRLGGTNNVQFRGNCYYNTGAFRLIWASTTYATFNAWQNATAQERISGASVAVLADPQLNAPGTAGTLGYWNAPALATCYRPASTSPVLTSGVNIVATYGVTYATPDLFGRTTPTVAPFVIGAGS